MNKKLQSWLPWILLLIALLIFIIAMATTASASGWDQSSITLRPGENITVEFTNTENAPTTLSIESISAPTALLPYVVFSPAVIPENAGAEVTITLVYVPRSILNEITQDRYAIKINDLVIYLDLRENTAPDHDIQAQLADIASRLAVLENRSTLVDDLVLKVQALENTPKDNWMPVINDIRARLENSNSSDNLDELRLEFEAQMGGWGHQQNEKISEANDNARSWAAIAGVGSCVSTLFLILIALPKIKNIKNMWGKNPKKPNNGEPPAKIPPQDLEIRARNFLKGMGYKIEEPAKPATTEEKKPPQLPS